MDLGGLIKHYRTQRGWSQVELGGKAKVEPAQIGRYERGRAKPELETLQNIADAFKVEISELLDDVPRSWKKARILAMCDSFREDLEQAVGDASYLTQSFRELVRFINHNF